MTVTHHLAPFLSPADLRRPSAPWVSLRLWPKPLDWMPTWRELKHQHNGSQCCCPPAQLALTTHTHTHTHAHPVWWCALKQGFVKVGLSVTLPGYMRSYDRHPETPPPRQRGWACTLAQSCMEGLLHWPTPTDLWLSLSVPTHRERYQEHDPGCRQTHSSACARHCGVRTYYLIGCKKCIPWTKDAWYCAAKLILKIIIKI